MGGVRDGWKEESDGRDKTRGKRMSQFCFCFFFNHAWVRREAKDKTARYRCFSMYGVEIVFFFLTKPPPQCSEIVFLRWKEYTIVQVLCIRNHETGFLLKLKIWIEIGTM